MIRSDAEYRDAVARSRKSAERLIEYREELQCQGLSDDEVEMSAGLMVSFLDDLNEEIGLYERIKEGDLSTFRTLREVGLLLIAARLARGLSQRELADRLEVHESQVSRDEKNEYQGISLERAAQILEVLSIDVQFRASLDQEKSAVPSGQPAESRIHTSLDDPLERHDRRVASPST
jgi:transcriptional regulator with XRE-family HTH domain